ncbi:hypothetical protein BMW23_0610 [Bodo saltans virus]|uniref:Cas12f1-like TNB domain-containing protein n=1 Tax=Bodo saltans virus TaxID=2024608 RepID=A0A2H4UUX6_9VIRU|nr:hypothetical protein QJ851_gp0593 [Bodo saltans virus]ATZ80656.1 hypothetical protein BMW23_0610 [Bodo saltans virus]
MMRRFIPRTSDKEFIVLADNISTYSTHYVDISTIPAYSTNIKTNSWFTNLCSNYSLPYHKPSFNFSKCENVVPNRKTIKINMNLNNRQKLILDKWFHSSNLMYNQTIIFLRKHISYCSIQNYNSLHKLMPKYYENCKNIKNTQHILYKKQMLYSSVLVKLEKLYITDNKTKKEYSQIITLKKKISEINIQITKLNIELDTYSKKNIDLSKQYHNYVQLEKHINTFLSYEHIRTKYLKKIRDNIALKYSCYNDDRKYKIHTHSLDGAIKQACAHYKTCITNLLDGNIKRFRVRCRNSDNPKKLVEIDSGSFNGSENDYCICKKILGNIDYTYNNNKYTLSTKQTSTIYFDGSKYTLLMPIYIEKPFATVRKPYTALDGGVRDFLTGFDNNSLKNYGHNVANVLYKYFNKIDKLKSVSYMGDNTNLLNYKNKLMSKKNYLEDVYICDKLEEIEEQLKYKSTSIEKIIENCKRIIKNNEKLINVSNDKNKIIKLYASINFNKYRIEKLSKMNEKEREKYTKYINYKKANKVQFLNKKIKWKIDELHWKIARELCENYEMIILGKLDTQSILKNKDLNKGTKRVLQSLSHYKFRERLVYKALSLGCKIIVQNEKYTTKTCTLCGHYNEWVTTEHSIDCKGCKKTYNRDNNGARNIFLKSLI